MALAILDLSGFGRGVARFQIDTGTNKYYRLKVGRSIERRNGIDWVGDLFFATKIAANAAGGGLLNSSTEVSIPTDRIEEGHAYVQLFTFKTPQGRSPAFSHVVKLPVGRDVSDDLLDDTAPELTMSMSTMMTSPFKAPRTVACRTANQAYAYQTSWMDLLGEVVKVATPVVTKLLAGAGQSAGATATAAPSAAGASSPDFLTQLLQAVLGGLQNVTSQNATPPAAAAPQQPAAPPSNANANAAGQTTNAGSAQRSQGQSVGPVIVANRFANGKAHHGDLSRPFIFGIDDMAIATLLGPFVKILPDLMNSANKRRVEMKQAQNALIGGIMSDINRRLLLDKLIEAQKQQQPAAPGAAAAPDLNQLIALLQQSGEGAAATQQSLPAATWSRTATTAPAYVLSNRAVLSFVTGDAVKWNGSAKLLYAKNQPLQFNVKFAVGEPVPQRPLPKALLKVTFKDSTDQTVWLEKTVRQKDLAPNTIISVPVSVEDAARLPANRAIAVVAELRWPAKSGPAHQALGSCDVVFVNQYYLVGQGAAVSPERELADMNQYRAFWNKVWESPSLDATRGAGDQKQFLWELDVNAKYTVLLAPDHDANGLMETKLLRATPDPESVTKRIEGRMKAGIELSVAEVNKLLSLWDAQPLDAARLDAVSTAAFAKANAGELVRSLKLRGRASERGLLWVIPVFKLFELTLGTPQKNDAAGQIVAVSEETVRFPLPVSVRIIGLKSQS